MEVYGGTRTRQGGQKAAECRERRRRRILIRRLAGLVESGSSSPGSRVGTDRSGDMGSISQSKQFRKTETGGIPTGTGGSQAPPTSGRREAELPPVSWGGGNTEDEPSYGVVSVMGRSRKMEDEVSAMTKLCRPVINGRRAVHFFAVYDGHGGTHVSTLCRENMHTLVQEELERIDRARPNDRGSPVHRQITTEERNIEIERKWRGVLERSFGRMNDLAMSECVCSGTESHQCNCDPVETAYVGSTAVAAILTQHYIIVANTGDSRAVLCRNGRAIPLSFDHKPDRPDERARIEAAGGRVLSFDGPRVEGILATSRAIGDKYLKPIVSWEPEVMFMRREFGDEFLILASDGLWDVLSNQVACNITRECLRERVSPRLDLNQTVQAEDRERGCSRYRCKSFVAATMLTRLALGRQSHDNISVIVVDLKNND